MSSRFICDCVKQGKRVKPVKNDDGQYVCAVCGIVLPDQFEPEKMSQTEEEQQLGSEMDFSNPIADPDLDTIISYADRLRDIQNRMDEEDGDWILQKHHQVQQEAVELSQKLGLKSNLERIHQVVQELIKLRFQDYESYDLLPFLTVVIVIKQDEVDMTLDTVVEGTGLNKEDLLEYFKIFENRTSV